MNIDTPIDPVASEQRRRNTDSVFHHTPIDESSKDSSHLSTESLDTKFDDAERNDSFQKVRQQWDKVVTSSTDKASQNEAHDPHLLKKRIEASSKSWSQKNKKGTSVTELKVRRSLVPLVALTMVRSIPALLAQDSHSQIPAIESPKPTQVVEKTDNLPSNDLSDIGVEITNVLDATLKAQKKNHGADVEQPDSNVHDEAVGETISVNTPHVIPFDTSDHHTEEQIEQKTNTISLTPGEHVVSKLIEKYPKLSDEKTTTPAIARILYHFLDANYDMISDVHTSSNESGTSTLDLPTREKLHEIYVQALGDDREARDTLVTLVNELGTVSQDTTFQTPDFRAMLDREQTFTKSERTEQGAKTQSSFTTFVKRLFGGNTDGRTEAV